jgi:metal-responsive CopG/Arc/MetJ family transcriptional regulator
MSVEVRMASAKGKVVVSTEIPEALRDEADKRAEREGRTRAAIIARALRFYLAHAPVVRADEIPAPKTGGKP